MREDENYIIDLCDSVLSYKACRQHKFDFLVGDKGDKLPVDAYYPQLHLVVEFHEKQHMESVPLFDNKMTVSGVPRYEQRRIYDQRRRDVLPMHGITIIEFTVNEFNSDRTKKIIRNLNKDKEIIKNKLHEFIQKQ